MKIVQSFWSKPSESNIADRNKGGWRHQKYFYMSWALSCLTLKRIYDKIELVTDKKGYELLIEKLKLPYTTVKVELDDLNHYPENLWAISKIYSYSIQEEPFIHVDGDVYLWSPFGEEIEKANLIAQHLDVDTGHYSEALQEIKSNNFFLPDVITNNLGKQLKIESINAGIIGGRDIEFVKLYCEAAFNMINKNMIKQNSHFTASLYALFYEQYLFSCLAKAQKKEITYYLNLNDFSESFILQDFQNKYHDTFKYVHMINFNKLKLEFCHELEAQLYMEFPGFYEIIHELTT